MRLSTHDLEQWEFERAGDLSIRVHAEMQKRLDEAQAVVYGRLLDKGMVAAPTAALIDTSSGFFLATSAAAVRKEEL